MNFTLLFAQAAPGNSMTSMVVMFAAMIGIFYFMVMRPQQKRLKEHKDLLGSVKRGDKVLLSNGMHGTIHEVEDKTVLIEIARNTVVKFDKGAIQSVIASA